MPTNLLIKAACLVCALSALPQTASAGVSYFEYSAPPQPINFTEADGGSPYPGPVTAAFTPPAGVVIGISLTFRGELSAETDYFGSGFAPGVYTVGVQPVFDILNKTFLTPSSATLPLKSETVTVGPDGAAHAAPATTAINFSVLVRPADFSYFLAGERDLYDISIGANLASPSFPFASELGETATFNGGVTETIFYATVPEPASVAVLAAGLLGLVGAMRRNVKQS